MNNRKYYIYTDNSAEAELYRRKLKTIANNRNGSLEDVNGVKKDIGDILDEDLVKENYVCWGFKGGKANKSVNTSDPIMTQSLDGKYYAKGYGTITIPAWRDENGNIIREEKQVNTDDIFQGTGYESSTTTCPAVNEE